MKVRVSRSWIYRGDHYGPGDVDVPDELVDRLREHDPGFSIVSKDSPSFSSQSQSEVPDDVVAGQLSGLGLTDTQINALAEIGVTTIEDVNDASDEELIAVRGIGKSTVKKLREGIDDQ